MATYDPVVIANGMMTMHKSATSPHLAPNSDSTDTSPALPKRKPVGSMGNLRRRQEEYICRRERPAVPPGDNQPRTHKYICRRVLQRVSSPKIAAAGDREDVSVKGANFSCSSSTTEELSLGKLDEEEVARPS